MKLIKHVLAMPGSFLLMFVTHLPGSVGFAVRRLYWGARLHYLGKGALIDTGVKIRNPEWVLIDDRAWIDRDVSILGGPDLSSRAKRRIRNENYPCDDQRGHVHIGKETHVGPRCLILGQGGVTIGDRCGIAANGVLLSITHHMRKHKNPSDLFVFVTPRCQEENQALIEGPVHLGSNVACGLNTIILPGTIIGDNSFVAIGALVGGKFASNSLIAGAPAKRIGKRFEEIQSER